MIQNDILKSFTLYFIKYFETIIWPIWFDYFMGDSNISISYQIMPL